MTGSRDYTVERLAGSRTVVLGGVMRLESTEAYARLFDPLRSDMVASNDRYTLDFSRVIFMNSSGIHALGTLVLAAKRARIPLRIRALTASPWQKKTLASLRLLYASLELEVADAPSG